MTRFERFLDRVGAFLRFSVRVGTPIYRLYKQGRK